MQLTLGETLYRLRTERKISAKQICEGLCDESTLSRARCEERAMDSLLLESIAGRMGVSVEEFTLMVVESEYAYRQWQEDVYMAIENAQWDTLRELLSYDIKGGAWINEKLQKQFYHYAKGIYLGSNMRYKEAYEELQIAQEKTIFEQTLRSKNSYLNTMELHMLMLSLFYATKGHIMEKTNIKERFEYLEVFIYDGGLDINEKARIYPKFVCIGLHCLNEQLTENQQRTLCEKAVYLLRKNKTFHDITELLRLYIPLLEKANSEKLGFYKKQYEVFFDLLQNENIATDFRPEIYGMRKPKIYLVHEYLSSKRHEKELTQEKLSEGICEPETYSRIECGKRTPSRRNFKALAERLDISWILYRGEIVSSDFKAYEFRRLQRQAIIEGNWKASLEFIQKLEDYLDMDIVENYQYINLYEYVLKCRLGLTDVETAIINLEELLVMTQVMSNNTSKLVYYSQTEMEIIAHLAQLYQNCNRYKDGILLIENVVKQMKHSNLKYEDQWNGFSILFRVLAGLYFEIGEYDTSIQIAKYVKQTMFRRREGANLPEVLDEIADGLEHKGKRYSEEYRKLYRYTYYIADFFTIEKVIAFAKKYYEDNFDVSIRWY